MRLFLLISSSLFFLSGCEVGPQYQRPFAQTPEQFKHVPAGWKFANPAETIDRGSWWQMFNDPLLNSLILEIEIFNQNLILAEAQYRQSLALVDQARASFFPTLTAATSANRQKSALNSFSSTRTGVNNLYSASLQASWEIDLWGSIRRSVEANSAGAEAAAANMALARLSAQTSLIQIYFELRAVDIMQKLLDDIVNDYQKLLKLTKNRHQMGIATGLDIAQAESQLKNAEVNAIDNQIIRATYEHAIAVLVGKPASSFSIMVNSSELPDPPSLPPVLPSSLLERRPDIAQAERQMAEANAIIGVNIAAYFPSFSLTGADGYQNTILHNLFNAPSKMWSIAGQVTQLLFDGGLVSGKVEAARANYDQAVANYRQTVLTAFQDTEDNLMLIRTLKTETKSQTDAVRLAKKQLTLTMDQYKSGTVYFSDVITAEVNYANARSKAISIASRRINATAGLIKSLGGGWLQSEVNVNLKN